MYNVKDFRQLIVYKKLLILYKEVLSLKLNKNELFNISKCNCKIAGYIAQSQGTSFYSNQSIYYFKKAIYWTNKLEKNLRMVLLEDKQKKSYLLKIIEIRKILIALKNKEERNDKSN